MADSKVSDLTSATSAGGSDVLYLVQSNTSKKITVANLFGNISNPTLSGNIIIGGTPQTLGSPGIVNITTPITHLSADATGGTLQIPAGTQGQFKLLTMTATAGGSYTVATSNIAGNTNIVFDAVGDTVLLYFTNSKWAPVASSAALDLTSISSNVIPSADSTFNLGSPSNQWKSLYVSNNTIFIGGTAVTVDGGELIVGSGEASANLATVSYVDAAVANVGGGAADTGNITFTNTTMSPPDQEDIILAAANSEVQITGEDFRVEVTDDIRLQASDLFSLRNISNADPITIVTDYNDSAYVWRFGEDGSFEIPGDTTVAGHITGTSGTSTLVLAAEPDSNTSIQLNDSVDSIIRTVANLEIRTNVSDTDKTWVFGTNGVLTKPGYINTDGLTGDNISVEASDSLTLAYTDGSTSESVFSAEQGRASISIIDTGTPGAKIELKTSNVIINNGQGSNPIDLEVSGNISTPRLVVDGDNFGGGLEIDTNFFPRISTYDTLSLGSRSAGINLSANAFGTIKTWTFSETGDLTIPGSIVSSNSFTVASEIGATSSGVFIDGANNVILFATSNAIIRSDNDGTFKDWTFSSDGNLTAPGTISANTVNATNSFGLPVYATDAARDTAIPSPQTGMMVYVSGGEGAGLQVRGANNWNTVSQTSN